jgi:hypothetical protein
MATLMASADDHERSVQSSLDDNGFGDYKAKADMDTRPVCVSIFNNRGKRIGGGDQYKLHEAIATAKATEQPFEDMLQAAGCI